MARPSLLYFPWPGFVSRLSLASGGSIPNGTRPAMELLADLTGEYLASGSPIHDGEVVELAMTGAAPFLNGYGVLAAIEARVLDASRAAAFRGAMAICTHQATALLVQQMGFSRLSRP